jgi:hypothetical protein
MHLSEQDAAAIYARACLSWYGGKAAQIVRAQIKHLRRTGDESGVKAWSQVAAQLSKAHQNRRIRSENGKLY